MPEYCIVRRRSGRPGTVQSQCVDEVYGPFDEHIHAFMYLQTEVCAVPINHDHFVLTDLDTQVAYDYTIVSMIGRDQKPTINQLCCVSQHSFRSGETEMMQDCVHGPFLTQAMAATWLKETIQATMVNSRTYQRIESETQANFMFKIEPLIRATKP